MHLTATLVESAMQPSPWDLGNQVLYDLCCTHPDHSLRPAVIAKVWLIGRSYAAAIERRREKSEANDDFYVNVVGPKIVESELDTWLVKARSTEPGAGAALGTLLEVHAKVTDLFTQISGLEKRSLASKYLHFHVPSLFYIYDSRAVAAMQKLSQYVGRASRYDGTADREYAKFAWKCTRLQSHVNQEFGHSLTPRQVDKLLLAVHESET